MPKLVSRDVEGHDTMNDRPEPILSIQGVSKQFRSGTWGIKDLSLDIHGGVMGLLGPNGAGKTTLMQMIATISAPTSGRILFRGSDIARQPDALRQKLGYLPQDFGVYDNLTAYEFLSYFASLKGVYRPSRIREKLESVNLHTAADRPVGGFSGGMKQRLGIAQALINDPELLIVDEPTAGLDPEERVRFRNVISEIGFGRLVILSTHIVSDIESVATQIAILRQGSLVTLATPEALLCTAVGKVWEAVVKSEEFEEIRKAFKISSAIRKPDGVHIRMVGPESGLPGAMLAEPSLEDAFLFHLNWSPGHGESGTDGQR